MRTGHIYSKIHSHMWRNRNKYLDYDSYIMFCVFHIRELQLVFAFVDVEFTIKHSSSNEHLYRKQRIK